MNTLTNLIPDLYAGLDQVSRELVGYVPAVGRNSTAERAQVGQAVRFHIAPAGNVSDVAPAMQIPEPTDQDIGSDTITITKARAAEFGFVGEEQRGLNHGPGYMSVQADMFAQALRALVNEVESDVSAAARVGTSRAVGTAGTTPFGSDSSDVANVRKVLMDNGAPQSDLHLVVDTGAGARLRTLYGIHTDRDWSQVPMSQQGVLVTPHGLSIRETGQPKTGGGGTATDVSVAGSHSVGATTIEVATEETTGAVDLDPGDVITIAGDDNKYVVAEAVEIGDNDTGEIVIQEPGLRVAASGDEDIESEDEYVANVGFYRNAIQLATRAPALPQEGDMAMDRMTLTDPRSGLAFEVSVYGGYRKVRFEVALAWGTKVVMPRHTALLLG